ncbi:hypothetical protein B0187_07525 [Haemophilus paracuniculus]|uniref:DNA methylase N-4/N-6 domain-containing protein n=1 Tax=Haemophilus paracuniculus TaxID=734 RepID=A0A1T0ARK0_9PAST|nr:DNA methyltransferase [Haemophilus paracuniculus]OOR98723.1 hypothetical protein B0187_07525 [Haemophilus paracuniculus]
MKKEIDYALVETTRPPIYTAMKYWGKKPHNIWAEYILNYTPEDGVFLDPFCGSGMSVIESLKGKRKTIGFDLNPLSTFMIEIFTSNYNSEAFRDKVEEIIKFVDNDVIYNNLYKYNKEVIHHVKFNNGVPYEVGLISYQRTKSNKIKETKSLRKPNKFDSNAIQYSKGIDLDKLELFYPNQLFPQSDSFNQSFIKNIGGNNFKNIWTERNLYVLALIFSKIKEISSNELQQHLLFGFIQTVHLCTKMSVPREEKAKRPFSTSWGRSAYLCANRQMEQNPLYVFKGSCFGKQSVDSALNNANTYLHAELNQPIKKREITASNKQKKNKTYQLKYGMIDINSLDLFLEEKSVDFILTDPPYGGLVQYLDLSYIWLIWLQNIDTRYKPNFDAEISVNKERKMSIEVYEKRFVGGLKQLHKVLKDDGKMVLTFHNKEIAVWNAFLRAIKLAGFQIEKVIHQQNLRAGESVVSNPYGTSGTDFYIRCVKQNSVTTIYSTTNEREINNTILSAAIDVIAKRNEPTPYQILFNGILANLSMSGQLIEDVDKTIETTLKKHIDSTFILSDNLNTQAGKFWWFKNPKSHINYPDIPLTERVEQCIISLLRANGAVTLDDVLKEVFMKFPNGLTPDNHSVQNILKKYAVKSQEKWVFQRELYEERATKHTQYIFKLIKLAKSLKYEIFVGKREQSEIINNQTLRESADYTNLTHLNLSDEVCKRLEMIDLVWLEKGKLRYLIEIENSTTITSAIQRASNANDSVERFIVIPNEREKELLNIKDKFFIDGFKQYKWKYITYSDIDNLVSIKNLKLSNIQALFKDI